METRGRSGVRWTFWVATLVTAPLLVPRGGAVGSDVESVTSDLYALDATTGARLWRRTFRLGDRDVSADIAQDLAIVLDRRALRGFDTLTGAERWRRRLDDDRASNAVVEDGFVYVIDGGGEVRAFDAATGALRWSVRNSGSLKIDAGEDNNFAVKNGVLIVSTQGGRGLQAFDASTGSTRWRRGFRTGIESVSAPGDVLVARDEDATLHAVELSTGVTRWTMPHPPTENLVFASLLAPFGGVVDAGSLVGVPVLDRGTGADGLPTTSTIFVDLATGKERWRTPSGVLSSFSFDPEVGLLFEYGEQRELLARDPSTGAVRWRASIPESRLLAAGSLLVAVPLDDGHAPIVALDTTTGVPRWSRRFPTGSRAPEAASNQVVLLTT